MTLLAILTPLLPGIIQGVEYLFKAKKGSLKKQTVIEMVAVVVKSLRDSGVLEGNPDVKEIANVVEVVVRHMKQTGQLHEIKDEGEDAKPVAKTQQVAFEGHLRYVPA